MDKRFFYRVAGHNDTFHRPSLIRTCDQRDPAATLSRNEFRGACLFATCNFAPFLPLYARDGQNEPSLFSPFFSLFLFPRCKIHASKVRTRGPLRKTFPKTSNFIAQKQIASFRNILEEGKKRGQFQEGGTLVHVEARSARHLTLSLFFCPLVVGRWIL